MMMMWILGGRWKDNKDRKRKTARGRKEEEKGRHKENEDRERKTARGRWEEEKEEEIRRW